MFSNAVSQRAAQHYAIQMPHVPHCSQSCHESCIGSFRKKKTGGVSISTMAPLTHLDNKMVERILQVVPPFCPP